MQAGEVLQAEINAPFDVLDANWDAVEVFCASGTQWRVGMGGATGLDYPAVESVMRCYRIKDRRGCLQRLQVIEREVLGHWQRQVKDRSARNGT